MATTAVDHRKKQAVASEPTPPKRRHSPYPLWFYLPAAVVYGVPALGFALLWLALAATITIKNAPIPFTPAFWAFTFPLGTVVTATATLARNTTSTALADLAMLLFAALLAAWLTAATATLRAQSASRWPRPTPLPLPATSS